MKRMYVVVMALTVAVVHAEEGSEALTLTDALARARAQQPSVHAAHATVQAAQARIDAARIARRPTVQVSASATTGSWTPRPCANDPSMTCGGYWDPTVNTGLALSGNWRIYDFGLTTANIATAESNAAVSKQAVEVAWLEVRRNVEVAYLQSIARQRLVEVARATVANEQAHVDQAERFVRAGAKDPIENMQARARFANAKAQLASMQANAAVAVANLRAAMGEVAAARLVIGDAWPQLAYVDASAVPALEALVTTALGHRPDLKQAEAQVAASEAALAAAARGRRPVLSATAQTQYVPYTESSALQRSTWSAGITVAWALFDGGRQRSDEGVASANAAVAKANRDARRLALVAELEGSRASILAAFEGVAASQEAVQAARAQLQLAEARYGQGVGNQIELADAQTAVTAAEGNLVSAQLTLADAQLALQRAVAP